MFVDQFDHPAAAARDAGQRVVGDDNRKPRFFHEQLFDFAQHGTTAGQYDAAFGDVGAKFGGCLFERFLDDADNTLQGFLQCFENFIAVKSETSRLRLLLDDSLTIVRAVIVANVENDTVSERVGVDGHDLDDAHFIRHLLASVE